MDKYVVIGRVNDDAKWNVTKDNPWKIIYK